MKKYFILFVLAVTNLTSSFAWENPFDLNVYHDFVTENQDISPSDLYKLYPSDIFKDSVPAFSLDNVQFMKEYTDHFGMTADEKSLIQKNGFVVTERLHNGSFFQQMDEIYRSDLPLFISTDAILHAIHMSYDLILKTEELGYIYPQLKKLLSGAHNCIDSLNTVYGNIEGMKSELKDVDVYLTVPMKLLGMSVNPYYPENDSMITKMLDYIAKEQMIPVLFFSDEKERLMDFSQFKPRGHYEGDDYLERYFRAMMWLGKVELYMDHPDYDKEPDVKPMVNRQIIDGLLIHRIFERPDIRRIYSGMEDVISFFVGKQDNVTLDKLDIISERTGLTDISDLLQQDKMDEFLTELRSDPSNSQHILSQIFNGCVDGTVCALPRSFLIFGQRFVIDSYVTAQVVYDRIIYDQENICRLFPSTLDVLFTLGNDASTQLLLPELNMYNYSDNLAGLRFLLDKYPEDFWESSLYNLWLYAIKSLSPDPKKENIPEFMKTGAWGMEKMNSQLSSWTELRHDNLLYAKQSYTGAASCAYPNAYVEPNPEFYSRLKKMAEIADLKFASSPQFNYVGSYFKTMYSICDTLGMISSKELAGTELSDKECAFLKNTAYTQLGGGCVIMNLPYGWYSQLIFQSYAQDLLEENLLVADYHTTPTDCFGNYIGWVSHAGTGHPDLLTAVVKLPNGDDCAFTGPVSSYHEFRTTNFNRLTDSEWKESYLKQSMRPEWVHNYLTDSLGNSGNTDLKLFTSREEVMNAYDTVMVIGAVPEIKETIIKDLDLHSYINNSSVLISYKLPEKVRGYQTTISVYNIRGEKIQTLLDSDLPPGNYMTRWNNTGPDILKGVYIIHLSSAGYSAVNKVLILK